MEGGRIEEVALNRPDLRFPFPADLIETMTGARVTGLGRRAKFLTIGLDNGHVVVSHLGMSGSWRVESQGGAVQTPGVFHHPRSVAGSHDHLIIRVSHDNGDVFDIIYNDPRRFGFVFEGTAAEIEASPHLSRLGVEPTGNALSADYLADRFAGKATSLKAALLDQSIIAGLGNIYVCEALWRSHLSPKRRAGSLVKKNGVPTDRLVTLTGIIRAVIAEAIEAGGSSLRDHKQTDGTLGYFQHRFAAYDRAGEPCSHAGCPGQIRRIVQNGRSTFYCSACQR